MKNIIADYFRRWGWVFALVGILQLCLGLFARAEVWHFTLVTLLYTGPMLLSFDLARGSARACRSLPLTGRQLARGWWFVTVLAPCLLWIGTMELANGLRVAFGGGSLGGISQMALWSSFALIWPGLSFYLLALLPANAAAYAANKTKSTVVSGLWGLSMGGGFFLLMNMPNDWSLLRGWHIAFLVGGAVCTTLGWGQAEEMVVRRAGPARTGADEQKVAGKGKSVPVPSGGASGIGLLIRTAALNTFRATGTFIAFFMLMQVFLRKEAADGGWWRAMARVAQDPVTVYVLTPMVLIMGLQWLSSLRHFRSLPVRAGRLSAMVGLLFGMPALLMAAALACLQLGFGERINPTECLLRMAMVVSPALLMPGLLLRFGLTWKSYLLVVLPVFASAPLAGLLSRHVPSPLGAAISALAWALGAWLIHRSVAIRGETYRQSMTWPMRTN